ncbi:MAG: hypothetical protein ABJK37_12990 [Paraglaciecola sp.]|uniref:DUF6942 family protein n=1 Tax=Paraglaciecola sp. TaxID=1920173 RepID=UPI003299D3FE
MPQNTNLFGLGDPHAQFRVYIANRPDYADFSSLTTLKPLGKGEIQQIGQACGNGWRKVFNVYAKLVFALKDESLVSLNGADTWQAFRDNCLLQDCSNTSLVFSAPQTYPTTGENSPSLHIIMGKTYSNSLGLPSSLHWLDNEFAVDVSNKLLVCPYFDYRQLSNLKIIRLVELITQLQSGNIPT